MNTQRFQVVTNTDCVCFCPNFQRAEQAAIKYADESMEAVKIFDRFAHKNKIDLWQVRPANTYLQPLRIKH